MQGEDDTQPRLKRVDLTLVAALFEPLGENPFFVKDAELRYVVANSAMARLCGVARSAQLVGRRAFDFFPAGLATRYEALDRQVLASARSSANNLQLTGATGKARPAWLLFSRLPVRDESGRAVGIAASARALARPDRRDPVYRRLAAAEAAIRHGLERPLDLAGLAARSGVSLSQLERDFRRVFGATPQELLTRARIERAMDLLGTPAGISEVAQACGFSDQSAFSRRFKAVTGFTPRGFRLRETATVSR